MTIMKRLILALVMVAASALHAAVPNFNDFNANQFGTSGYKVNIKSGVLLTNATVYGQLLSPSAAFGNNYDNPPNAGLDVNSIDEVWLDVDSLFTGTSGTTAGSSIAVGGNGTLSGTYSLFGMNQSTLFSGVIGARTLNVIGGYFTAEADGLTIAESAGAVGNFTGFRSGVSITDDDQLTDGTWTLIAYDAIAAPTVANATVTKYSFRGVDPLLITNNGVATLIRSNLVSSDNVGTANFTNTGVTAAFAYGDANGKQGEATSANFIASVTGTPTGSKYLRDDWSWQTPPGSGSGDTNALTYVHDGLWINAARTFDGTEGPVFDVARYTNGQAAITITNVSDTAASFTLKDAQNQSILRFGTGTDRFDYSPAAWYLYASATVLWAKLDVNERGLYDTNAALALDFSDKDNVFFPGAVSATTLGAENFYPTNTFTGITNAAALGTDGDGKLIVGSGGTSGDVITNGYTASITFSNASTTLRGTLQVAGAAHFTNNVAADGIFYGDGTGLSNVTATVTSIGSLYLPENEAGVLIDTVVSDTDTDTLQTSLRQDGIDHLILSATKNGAASLTNPAVIIPAAVHLTHPKVSVSLIADNQVVDTYAGTHISITSDNATPGNRTFLLGNGQEGVTIILSWPGTNAGELIDDSAAGSGNVRLSADWTPTQYDTLTLIGEGNDWFEVSRSAN